MITREQALWALDNMDDYARMAGVIALGPMNVLRQYIWQSAPVAEQATKEAAEDAELLDRYGKIRGDLKASAYCVGNEYKPFHPSASHVRPEWRDGWNACYVAAIRAARAAERKA